MEIIVVLHNIRSTYNVGSVLRTCDVFGFKKAVFSGYTPRLHDPKLLPHLRVKLDKQIEKTALGAEASVEIAFSDDIRAFLVAKQAEGYIILGLENNISDKRLFRLNDTKLFTLLDKKVILLLGEEVHGIPESLYDQINYFVEIPMRGQKESFNVSIATAIALYELTRSI